MRAIRPIRPVAAAALLASVLGGCFVHTEGSLLGVDRRGDVAWLEGGFLDPDERFYRVTHEGLGVYRFSGEAAEVDPQMRSGVAMLIGDCSIPPVGDLPPQAAEACGWSVERLCADPDLRFGDEAECLRTVGALRDPAKLAALGEREAAPVESMRWIGESLPWRDDVLFTVAPLGEDFALAQVRRIGSYGPYTDLAILDEELHPHDLVILRRDAARGGFEAWATELCVDGDQGDAALPMDTALATMAACAQDIAAGNHDGANRKTAFLPAPRR